jgi:hypothetical protein
MAPFPTSDNAIYWLIRTNRKDLSEKAVLKLVATPKRGFALLVVSWIEKKRSNPIFEERANLIKLFFCLCGLKLKAVHKSEEVLEEAYSENCWVLFDDELTRLRALEMAADILKHLSKHKHEALREYLLEHHFDGKATGRELKKLNIDLGIVGDEEEVYKSKRYEKAVAFVEELLALNN